MYYVQKMYIIHGIEIHEYYAAFEINFLHRESCLVKKHQPIGEAYTKT